MLLFFSSFFKSLSQIVVSMEKGRERNKSLRNSTSFRHLNSKVFPPVEKKNLDAPAPHRWLLSAQEKKQIFDAFNQMPPCFIDKCCDSVISMMISLNCNLPSEVELLALLRRAGFDENSPGCLTADQLLLAMDLWKATSISGGHKEGETAQAARNADLTDSLRGLFGSSVVEVNQIESIVSLFDLSTNALGFPPSPLKSDAASSNTTVTVEELVSLFSDQEELLAEEFQRMGATDLDNVCKRQQCPGDHYLGDHWRETLALPLRNFFRAVCVPPKDIIEILRRVCPKVLMEDEEHAVIDFDDFRRIAAHLVARQKLKMEAGQKAHPEGAVGATQCADAEKPALTTQRSLTFDQPVSIENSLAVSILPSVNSMNRGYTSSSTLDAVEAMRKRVQDMHAPLEHEELKIRSVSRTHSTATMPRHASTAVVQSTRRPQPPPLPRISAVVDSRKVVLNPVGSNSRAAPDAVVERLAQTPPWRAAWHSSAIPADPDNDLSRNEPAWSRRESTIHQNGHRASLLHKKTFHDECMSQYKAEFTQMLHCQ